MKEVSKLKEIDISKLSNKEKLALIEKIEKLEKEIERKKEEAINQDPYWYFEPSDGTIPEEGLSLLQDYLKPEDIPQRLDGQLDVILSQAEICGGGGGNQSGKSTLQIIKGIIKSTGELPKSLEPYRDKLQKDIDRANDKFVRGRVIAVDFKQLNNTVLYWWRYWFPKEYLKNGSWKESFSVQHNVLTVHRKNVPCGTVEFMTNQQDVDSFQGPPIDWIAYDEEPKQSIYKENLLRFTTSDRLDIGIYWTPTHGLSWATDMFEEDKDSMELFKLCSVTNKKANLKTLEGIIREINPSKAKSGPDYEATKMRLLGEFVSLSGLVYGKLFDQKIHVIDPFYENLLPDHQREHICLYGFDPHLVTNTAGVFMLVDREGNHYIDRCYFKDADTDELKQDFWDIVKTFNYRPGWGACDKSADSTIIAFGGRNIFKEITRGKDAIPALRTSEKYEGSIKAGVNEIKKLLKINKKTKKPGLFIVNRPENKMLIQSFRTLERDTYANEDEKGPKDRIKEGKHHLHAALRYIFQYPISWYPEIINVPEFEMLDEAACY